MNNLIDALNDFLSARRGLLPMVGVGLILVNFLIQIIFDSEMWIVSSNLFLHLGLITAIVGVLLIRPLQ
ncbi:MAG: hypothetical protein AAF902_05640 [Chloroflexota bacterium]